MAFFVHVKSIIHYCIFPGAMYNFGGSFEMIFEILNNVIKL